MCYYFREERKGTLTIDANWPITDESDQGATQLDTDGHLWIGSLDYFFHNFLMYLLWGKHN